MGLQRTRYVARRSRLFHLVDCGGVSSLLRLPRLVTSAGTDARQICHLRANSRIPVRCSRTLLTPLPSTEGDEDASVVRFPVPIFYGDTASVWTCDPTPKLGVGAVELVAGKCGFLVAESLPLGLYSSRLLLLLVDRRLMLRLL